MGEGPVPGSGAGPFVVGGHSSVIPIVSTMGIRVVWRSRATTRPLRAGTKEAPMLCDCGTCCDTCGHDTNCTSQQGQAADPSDDYTR